MGTISGVKMSQPTPNDSNRLAQASPARVLVIDDEPDLCTLYELTLTREGHEVDVAQDLTEARRILKHTSFDVVLTDMRLPDGLGLELVRELTAAKRSERCVVITAYGSAENAVQALKAGAFDYLTKPVEITQFRQVVRDAFAGHADEPEVPAPMVATQAQSTPKAAPPATAPKPSLGDAGEHALSMIVGASAVMTDVKARVAKVARSMAPVMVHGESGTGKELIARALHACSHRAAGPFVAVNCAAIPENLLEAEFFGALKGSYTGINADRLGFFQAASGGTLFLDELGELPLAMQSKLLRAIQERHVRPLGSTAEVSVDVRIVSATHRDLIKAVASGSFRQDLYYRVNVIEVLLPPLRDRREDLSALCDALLARITGQSPPRAHLSPASLNDLMQLPLNGNVRELENLLHRALALADGDVLDLGLSCQLPEPIGDGSVGLGEAVDSSPAMATADHLPKDLTAYLDGQEKVILLNALRANGYNRTAAALQLGISLRQIRYRIARLKIDTPNGSTEDPCDGAAG